MRDWAHSRMLGTPADEAGSVVVRQTPASKLANLFRIDVRDHALGLVTQQLGGRVKEHPPAGWLGPRTPSLREGNQPVAIALLPSRRDHFPEKPARVGQSCRILSVSGSCGGSMTTVAFRSIYRTQSGPNSGLPNTGSGRANGRWRVPHDDWPVRAELGWLPWPRVTLLPPPTSISSNQSEINPLKVPVIQPTMGGFPCTSSTHPEAM